MTFFNINCSNSPVHFSPPPFSGFAEQCKISSGSQKADNRQTASSMPPPCSAQRCPPQGLGDLRDYLQDYWVQEACQRSVSLQVMHDWISSVFRLYPLAGPLTCLMFGFCCSSGLFPLLSNAAMSVKPVLLGLYETYYLPLGKTLKPGLQGLLTGVLPGLEEGSEYYDRFGWVLLQNNNFNV